LVAVDALVVSGVEGAGFFWLQREIAEALTGAHFSWAQDQVIGVHTARIALPVLGECELDGGKGVTGFEGADFGQADSVKFLEGEGAGAPRAARSAERGVMRLRKSWARAPKSRTTGYSKLSAARRRLGKGAPGSGLFRVLHSVFGFCQDLDKSAAPRKALSRGHVGVGAFLRLGGVMILLGGSEGFRAVLA